MEDPSSTVDRLPLQDLLWFRAVEASLAGSALDRVPLAAARHAAEVADHVLQEYGKRFPPV